MQDGERQAEWQFIMQYEVELKYRIDDDHRLTKLIKELDAEHGATCDQIDRYFNHPSRNFAETDEALAEKTF